MKSLPKTVTRQRRGCDLNPGRSAPESSTLTTRLPSHHKPSIDAAYCCRRADVICRGLTDGDADVSGSGWDEPEQPCRVHVGINWRIRENSLCSGSAKHRTGRAECGVHERKCEGATLKYKYIPRIKYTEAILSSSTPKLSWFEISKMLIAV